MLPESTGDIEAGISRKESGSPDDWFWGTRHIELFYIFGSPLIMALLAPLFVVDFVVFVSSNTFVALGSFFAFIIGTSAALGYALRISMEKSALSYGQKHPYRFVTKVDSIGRSKWVAFGLAIALYVIDSSPGFVQKFDLLSYSLVPFLVRISILYSLTLMVFVLPIIAWNQDPFTYTKLSLLTELDEERHISMVNDTLAYFNRVLRRKGSRLKIRDDFSLEAKLLDHPENRKFCALSLLEYLDEQNPKRFLQRLSMLTDEPIDAMMTKFRLLTTSNVLGFLGAIATLYALTSLVPTIQTVVQKILGG